MMKLRLMHIRSEQETGVYQVFGLVGSNIGASNLYRVTYPDYIENRGHSSIVILEHAQETFYEQLKKN